MTNTNNKDTRNLGALFLNGLMEELTKAGLAEEYGFTPVATQEEVIAPVEGTAIPEVCESPVEVPNQEEQPAEEPATEQPTTEQPTTEEPAEATTESAGAWGLENFYYNCNGIEIELGSLIVKASPEVIAKLKAILSDPKQMLNPIVEKFIDAEIAAQGQDFTEVPTDTAIPEAPAEEQTQTTAPEAPKQEEEPQAEAPEAPKQEEEPKAEKEPKNKQNGKNKK